MLVTLGLSDKEMIAWAGASRSSSAPQPRWSRCISALAARDLDRLDPDLEGGRQHGGDLEEPPPRLPHGARYTAGGSLIFYTFTTYMQKYLVNTTHMDKKTANLE